MIAHIFDLPEWLLIGFVAAGALGIVVPLTARSIRRFENANDHNSISIAGWALGFVGGSFVFAGTFTTVTVWEVEQTQAAAIMSEFTAATEFVQGLRTVDPEFSAEAQRILLSYADLAEDRELDELTGLPKIRFANGDDDTAEALDDLYFLIESAQDDGTLTQSETTAVLQSYEAIAAARLSRLALRSPLPKEIASLLAVVSVATLVALGTFPSGRDRSTRWIMTFTGTAIVISVLATVIVLVSPGSDIDSRLGPVEDFRTWVDVN